MQIPHPVGALFSTNFLINTRYRESLAKMAGLGVDSFVVPCRLRREAGFVRGWCARVNGQQTTVNARRARAGESAHALNGVLTTFDDERMLAMADDGEFVRLDRAHLDLLGWQNLPPDSLPIWIFEAADDSVPDVDFPILQSGVDLVVEGCLEHGEGFAREFLESSGFWSRYWLNDRELPRRPWVHQPRWKQIDQLLAAHPRAASHNRFSERRLETAYTELFADDLPPETLAVATPPVEDMESSVEPPRHFIFGFGSLINTESRRASNPQAAVAVPARIDGAAGYSREWNFQSADAKLTALGVTRNAASPCSINGVVYPCDDIDAFDERESGYTRLEVPREHLEFVSWKRVPDDARIWIYVPDGPQPGHPGEGLEGASFDYPMLQTYVDICVLGCLEHGREFALEFLRTTRGWTTFWLNDRRLARRPWVHQPRHKEIDALLLEALGEDVVNERKLGVEYARLRLDG